MFKIKVIDANDSGTFLGDDFPYPYDSKSMGLIWQFMAHIWPICGKDMEWLLDCMELIW